MAAERYLSRRIPDLRVGNNIDQIDKKPIPSSIHPCYNELVVAFFSTGGGVKGKKNLYLLTLLFIFKLAFILFAMTPGAQTTGNIAVYGSAKQLVI